MRAFLPFLLAATAIFCGTLLDVIVKALGQDISVLTIVAWRYLLGAVIIFAIWRGARKPWPSWRAVRFHAYRGAVQLTAAGSFFYALTQLALAEATVLGFTAALMVAPMGVVILGERMSRVAIMAAGLGFLGAVLAIWGATGGQGAALAPEGNRVAGVVAALMAATTYALSIILIRLRTREEDSLTIVMFSNVVPAILVWGGCLLAAPVVPVAAEIAWPQAHSFGLVAVAILGLLTWSIYTKAFSLAPPQQLAPFEYTALIWSSLFGYLWFSELPGWKVYMGGMIVIAACLLVAFEGHFAARRATKMPLSDPLA